MKIDVIKPEPPIDIREIRTFRAENFPVSQQLPWLDRPDARERIAELHRLGELDDQQAMTCSQWVEQGYVVLPHMYSAAELERAWNQYEEKIARGAVKPTQDYGSAFDSAFPGRVLNPHFHVPEFENLLNKKAAIDLVSLLLGAAALPFQTISGHRGSQQKAHSDSIHMTTYPQGYLVANWIAFEDIAPDSGPLEFYPGSHKLPYAYARECGIDVDEARAGYGAYHEKYEPFIQSQIAEHKLEAHYFHAQKGDVLFWHANLLHGGSPIRNSVLSRRALVCHYFAQGCICYHDYTGTPSYLTEIPALGADQFPSEDYLRLNPDVAAAGVDPYKHYLEFGIKEKRRVR